uniref:Elongation factor Tu n=1 Tax=Anthurium amnicola TaxID=1678845 RepID=A0A1D1Z5S6_9ARAE
MTFIKKSLTIVVVLAAYMLVAVFAVKVNTGNNVCKVSKLDKGNGSQNRDGQCVQTPLGEVPDVDKMVSTLIRSPRNNQVLIANKPFTIKTETINLETGFFDDPVKQYYIFPQTLNKKGIIQGHNHVTIQKLIRNEIPDPRNIAFFKGLNDKAENGILSVKVENGLPAGKYRLCTMVSSFAHQPVLMPIAQRGAQDDCVRFTVRNSKK